MPWAHPKQIPPSNKTTAPTVVAATDIFWTFIPASARYFFLIALEYVFSYLSPYHARRRRLAVKH